MAQFNSLTDRVRQMLGGMVQQAPKTLSDIGNAVIPNLSASMQGAKTLSQNVSYFAPKAIQNVGRAIANPQTAQPNFDLLRQNSSKNVLGKFATNTIANAGESFFSGANQMVDASNTYAKNKYNPVSYVKGAMGLAKMVAPTTPFFQGATALQSGGQSFKIPLVERLATGGLRGQTNTNINPLMQEQKINTPVGSFDPITAIGSLAGFTKNPAWNEIFKETSLLLKTAPGASKLLSYLSTRGTKGGVEGFIQGLSEIRDDMTPKDIVQTLAGQTAFGVGSEIVMDKSMEKTGQLIKKMAKVARETFTTMSPSQKAFNQIGMVDINAPIGKPMFDGEYERGDVSRLTEEMDKILGIPKDIKSLKQKQTLFEQNYRAMQEAADAGIPEAKADLDKFTRLYNEADVVRKAKDVKVESQYSGYKRVPTPEELRAKMAQDAQRAAKAGTQATGGMDAVWNNDPTLKARIDDAFSKGDTATVQKLLPQVPEQYKGNYVSKAVDPLLSEAKKYKSAEEFIRKEIIGNGEIRPYKKGDFIGSYARNDSDRALYYKGKFVEFIPEGFDKKQTENFLTNIIKDKEGFKSQLTDIWNQANKGVESPITKLESQLHPDDVKTLKVDKEIEGWSDKQYKSILEDKVQELKDFASGQMSKDANYVDLQSSINELRKTAKEIGKSELARMVEIEANKISDPEQARQYIMDGLRGIRDQRFANQANTVPVGKVDNAKIQSIKKDLDWYDNWFGLNDWKASKSRIKEMNQARDALKEELVRLEGATTGGVKVANTSQPKTPRTIKVVDQSKTQQPISSPVSDSVGTQVGVPAGQTSQSSLGTESLNKSIPQRGFAESVQSNKKTPAEIKPELEKIRYEPIANADIMAQADKIIKSSESKALDFAKNNTDTTANSVSLKLIEKYLDQGRFSEANDLITAVSPRFTKAGQEIQILSTYGRLTPTGAIKYAQTLINQANKANPRLNLKLTEANTKIITEFANKVQSLPEGSRERVVATAQLMQKISDQIPSTIGKKIATIQTMMQLLNPKTAVRNILGNTIFTGAENVSDVFATGIDRVTSLITGKRSKVLPSLSAQGKGFGKGLKEGYQDAMLGIDTSGGVSSQFDIKGKTFTDPILGTLEKALNIELRVPDRAAYTAAFEGSLNNQMRAGGVTKATPEMIEIAHADGLYRTFQDNSRLAQIFSGIKKTLNKIGTPDGKFGLGDFVLKYPKTPANILSRGLDYSPAGFVKGVYEGVRPFISGQPFNQKQFVESLSRAMTGTGLIAAGYVLAKNGIISGKNDKDYDISSVKRTTGQGAFKMNVSALARYFQSGGQKQDDQNGDTLVSYDWAQPTSIQVAMGANSALGGSAEDIASIASDNLQAGVDTLTGQSMVKNLMDYAGGVKDKGFVGATQDMVLNSATGFIPSVLRQSSNVFDPTQRSTYAETPGGVAINKAKATIPFLRNTLEPKLDVFGKEMPNYEGSGLQRMFDIFVNPAFVTKIQENPAAKEVIDIYQRSGLTTQAPRVADSKIKINGQDIKVSPQQYTEYQKYIGTKTDKTFNSLMTDPLFMKSSDEEKAKFLQGVLTDINSAAKIELFGNKPKTVPQDVKDVIKSSGDLTGRMVTLTKEGNLKMATGDIEYPKPTGNTELDKKLITAYRGKITQKANEITAMYEAGEITAAQAETELNKLIELKNKVSTAKAKKAPKITIKKLSAPKVARSARIKIKIPKIKKPKTLKLKKYTVKLSK